jgi:hypothetical protein
VVNLYAILSSVAAMGLIVCLGSALLALAGVAIDNLFSVRPRGPGLSELSAMREARLTWFVLPAVAYVLSVVTNLATSAMDEEGYTSDRGWDLLFGGLVGLEAVAAIAVVRAGRRRDEFRALSNWALLFVEVERWEAEGGAVPLGRLGGAERQATRLATERNRSSSLNRRALDLLEVEGLEWDSRPTGGLFLFKSHGDPVHVPFRKVGIWMWTLYPSRAIASALAASILLFLYLFLVWNSPDVPAVVLLRAGLIALIVGILGFAYGRASLIYRARLQSRNLQLRTEIDSRISSLRRIEPQAEEAPLESPHWTDIPIAALRLLRSRRARQ